MPDHGVELDALQRPVPKRRGMLSADATGHLVHSALADLLTADRLDQPPPVLRGWVARRLSWLDPAYRQVLTARVGTALVRYARHCRRAPSWRFLGAEVNAEDVRLDLLFIDAHGRIEADEVKSGADPRIGLRDSVRRQVASQVAAGRGVFGARFAGVRLVVLADPRQTVLITEPLAPDGRQARP